MQPRNSANRPNAKFVAVAVAVASVGTLVALTALGILDTLPKPAATLIVVVELLAPAIVYFAMKRRLGNG